MFTYDARYVHVLARQLSSHSVFSLPFVNCVTYVTCNTCYTCYMCYTIHLPYLMVFPNSLPPLYLYLYAVPTGVSFDIARFEI